MGEWTTKRWKFFVSPREYDSYPFEILTEDKEEWIARDGYVSHPDIPRRIVAAVNTCAGISTEALEQGVVEEMHRALRTLVKAEWMVTHDWGGDRDSVYENACAVLAKLGEQS